MAKTKKLTISIPNEIFNRLQSVKKEFNVSAICARALQRQLCASEACAKIEQAMRVCRPEFAKLGESTCGVGEFRPAKMTIQIQGDGEYIPHAWTVNIGCNDEKTETEDEKNNSKEH